MDPTYCEFELGSLDSESKVLTVTPWDLFVVFRKIFNYIKALRNSDTLTIRGRDGIVPECVPCLVKNALAASLPQLRLCMSPQHESRDKDQRTRRGRGKHCGKARAMSDHDDHYQAVAKVYSMAVFYDPSGPFVKWLKQRMTKIMA